MPVGRQSSGYSITRRIIRIDFLTSEANLFIGGVEHMRFCLGGATEF